MFRFYLLILLAALIAAPVLVPANQAVAAGSEETSANHDLFAVQEYMERLDTEIKGSIPQVHFKEMVNKLVKEIGRASCRERV